MFRQGLRKLGMAAHTQTHACTHTYIHTLLEQSFMGLIWLQAHKNYLNKTIMLKCSQLIGRQSCYSSVLCAQS